MCSQTHTILCVLTAALLAEGRLQSSDPEAQSGDEAGSDEDMAQGDSWAKLDQDTQLFRAWFI